MNNKVGFSFIFTGAFIFVLISLFGYWQHLIIRPKVYFTLFILIIIGSAILIQSYFLKKAKISRKKAHQIIYLVMGTTIVTILIVGFISLFTAILPVERTLDYKQNSYIGLKRGRVIELYKVRYFFYLEENPDDVIEANVIE
ncbi:MAG: hypothetical protein SPI53_03480 [Erysipelotrichaceae bacterium]|nr:hypothetical protein [Erysipelotrichaceae bacterium]